MRIAIHPQTLDIREFRPGMGYQSKGYVIVKGAEGLYEIRATWVSNLFTKITGSKPKSIDLKACILLWPDLVVRAINNVKAAIEVEATPDAGPGEFEHEVMQDSSTMKMVVNGDVVKKPSHLGRGNHKLRYPDFTIMDVELTIKIPTQAQILFMEFQNLRKSGHVLVTQKEMGTLIDKLGINTRQDPMRIFRYYFWLLVRTGVLKPTDGTFNNDRVVQMAQARGFFKAWRTVLPRDAVKGITPDGT